MDEISQHSSQLSVGSHMNADILAMSDRAKDSESNLIDAKDVSQENAEVEPPTSSGPSKEVSLLGCNVWLGSVSCFLPGE